MGSGVLEVSLSEPLWILVALAAGLGARAIGLPLLVGYLAAGFGLHALGAEPGPILEEMAHLGVSLLLFSIGLRLDLREFKTRVVWTVGVTQCLILTVLFSGIAWLLILLGIGPMAGLSLAGALIIGVTLSFSSTVFAVKVIGDRGADNSGYGRIAITILLLQDVLAVSFLVAAASEWPSAWALLLVPGLAIISPVSGWLLRQAGHRELLMLFGVGLAMAGSAVFESVGLSGDLGALILGLLLARNPRSGELYRSVNHLRDFFLVAFFLSIGIEALPTPGGLLCSALFLVVLLIKPATYYLMLSASRVRSRTSWQASLNLATYSEFGLVALVAAAEAGWIGEDVLAMMAVLIAGSFAVAAPLSDRGEWLYSRWRSKLKRFQRSARLPGDEDLELTDIDVVVLGLGRMGSRAYDVVHEDFGGRVLGIDNDDAIVELSHRVGRNAIVGDATDADLWSRAHAMIDRLHWVLLTMPSHATNLSAVEQLREHGFTGRIAATSAYPDEAEQLRNNGVDFVFDIFGEAGAGFADDLSRRTNPSPGAAQGDFGDHDGEKAG